MKLTVAGNEAHVATGGKTFDPSLPTVLFLHGSGSDHRTWALQTRWFAFHGYSVLAPDFPAHSLSAGEPLASIESSAPWLIELLDAAGCGQVHVAGHSQGFLSSLELCRQYPDRVLSISGIASGAAIPVNQMLLDAAAESSAKAANMMLNWGFGSSIHQGASPTPGMQPIAIGRRIMSNNPLSADLQACANYTSGLEAAASINVPANMLLAAEDKMTPVAAGKAVADALNATFEVVPGHGHMLPIEAPKVVLNSLREFISNV